MRDRTPTKLGIYTKAHGFMTINGFNHWKPAQPGDKKPEQVTACEYRRISTADKRKARTPDPVHIAF